MPRFLDDIVIRFGGDDKSVQRVADRVKGIGADIAGSFGKIGEIFSSLGRGGIAAAVAGVGTAMVAAGRSALDWADSLVLTADKIGVTTEELQELRFWAQEVGVEERVLDTALQRFSRRLGEAAQGTGTLYKELQQAGIQLRDADGNVRRVADVWRDYADAVRNAGSQQERLRLVVAATDIEGAGLVNAFVQGAEAIEQASERARELGVILEEDLVRQTAELETEWNLWLTRMDLRWKKFILSVVDTLDDWTGSLRGLEEVQERIAENNEKIRKTQEEINRESGRNQTAAIERLRRLKEENEELKALEKNLLDAADAQASLTDEREQAAAQSEKERAKTKTSEDFRKKTPEEIAAALNAFRRGEISQAELGERTGLQPPGTVEATPRGAFGTETNKGEGAIREGVPTVVVGPDVEGLNRQLEAFFQGKTYKVRIEPVLEEGIEGEEGFTGSETGGLPEAANQLGLRQ